MAIQEAYLAIAIDVVVPAPAPAGKSIWQKIMDVVKVIFAVLASIVLFVVNPTLFLVGLLIGLTFPEKVKEVVQKIKNLCGQYPVAAGFTVAGSLFIAWPAVLMVSSVGVGAHLGSQVKFADPGLAIAL